MLLFFGSLVFNLEIEAFLERLKALLLSSGARSLLSKLGLSGGLAGLALRALITISGVASDIVGPHDALWVGFGHKASPAGNGLFPSVLPRELQFRRLGGLVLRGSLFRRGKTWSRKYAGAATGCDSTRRATGCPSRRGTTRSSARTRTRQHEPRRTGSSSCWRGWGFSKRCPTNIRPSERIIESLPESV